MHIAFDVIYCVKMTLRMHLINVNGRFFLQNFRKKPSNIRNIYTVRNSKMENDQSSTKTLLQGLQRRVIRQ